MLIKGTASQILLQKDTKKTVILVHGYKCNPLIFKELSELLFKQGFSVFNIRLPGHGCQNPRELLKVSLRDWQMTIENTFLDVCDQYTEVSLIGITLGTSLIFDLAAKYKDRINKIVAISPLLKLANWIGPATFLLRFFMRTMHQDFRDPPVKNGFMDTLRPYNFRVTHHIWEFFKLTVKNRKKLKSLGDNVMCFLSRHDQILDLQKHLDIIQNETSFKHEILENSEHMSIYGIEKDYLNQRIIEWLEK